MNAPAGTNYTGYQTTSYATLTAWQAGTGHDAASSNENPLYFDASSGNYKPTNALIDNLGFPVGVSADILGNLRSPSTPDAGAYEFTVAAKDVGVFNIVSPLPTGCYTANETFIVTIRNYGYTAIDFSVDPVSVFCQITGPVNTTVSAVLNSGTLGVGATQNVSLSPTVDGTANGTYTINAYTVMASDGDPANDAFPVFNINVGPVAGTVSASQNEICISGTPTLNVVNVYGGSIQWQESTISTSGPWTNVGTNSTSYAPGTVTQTTHYRAVTVCNSNEAASNVVTITVNNPSVLSTSPATRCGIGTVTLGATGSPGTTLKWYTTPTGGSPVATGNTFITPVISSTTDFYVSASSGSGGLQYVGLPAISGSTAVVSTYYMNFTVLTPLTIQSVNCYFNTIGAPFTLNIRNASTLVSVFTYSGTTTVSGTTTPQTLTGLLTPVLTGSQQAGPILRLYRGLSASPGIHLMT
jgi:hypothetical protein